MEDMVDTVLDQLERLDTGPVTRVTSVRLQIGAGAGVVVDALRFCFDVCTRGTPLEDATLEIDSTAGAELRLVEVEVR